MTILNLSVPVFYKAGASGVSAVVGYESHANRVVRYSFTTPEGGASSVRLAFSGNHKGNGTTPAPLAFYIGTDPGSHGDGGVNSPKTGLLTALADGVSYSGTADLVLLPATTYYVWVFPNTTAFGWMTWSRSEGAAVISLDGAATSRLTAPDGTLGQPLALGITRYADLPYRITCAFLGETVTVAENARDEVCTWTPPLWLASCCTDADHAIAQYTIETFRDGVSIGKNTATARLSVPASCVPTVSFIWENTALHREFFQPLLQSVSVLEVTPVAEGVYGSTVRSVSMTLNGKPFKNGIIEDAGEVELTVTATDSRGRSASQREMLTVLPYAAPKVTLTAIRVDENGDLDDMGEFAKLTATCTHTPLDTIYPPGLGIGLVGDEPTMMDFEGDTYTVTLPAPSTEAPEYEVSYIDNVLNSVTARTKLSIGYATMDVLSGGKGVAFGITATREGFHCAMPAYFTGGVEGADRWQEENGCLYRMVDGQREWLTPPLLENTEYRTAERWKGKPVYTKLCVCEGLDTTAPAHNWFRELYSASEVIYCAGNVYSRQANIHASIPFHDKSHNAITCWGYEDGRIVVSSSYVSAYDTAFVQVKYIK